MRRTLKFSEEWDKLKPKNFKVGNTLTTFRSYDPRKHKYYASGLEKIFNVKLHNEIIGKVKLISLRFAWSCHLDDSFIKQDTYENWNRKKFDKMIKKFYEIEPVFGLV